MLRKGYFLFVKQNAKLKGQDSLWLMFQKNLDFGYMWKLFPFLTHTECGVKM